MDPNILTPIKKHDVSDLSRQIHSTEQNYVYQAIVKSADEDIVDRYKVDVYDNGYIGTATRSDLQAHALNAIDTYFKGDHVRVLIQSDTSCLILSEKIPQLVKVVDSGPASEDDFTTNQYWGSFAYIKNTDNAPDSNPAQTEVYTEDSPFWAVVSFTNTGEATTEHGELALDDYVYITWEWDRHDPDRLKRWLLYPPQKSRVIYVTLTTHGGSNGSVSGVTVTNATYTYDLHDPITSDVIKTNVTPAGVREQGPLVSAATIGLARNTQSGWVLIWCDERALVVGCT